MEKQLSLSQKANAIYKAKFKGEEHSIDHYQLISLQTGAMQYPLLTNWLLYGSCFIFTETRSSMFVFQNILLWRAWEEDTNDMWFDFPKKNSLWLARL